MVFVFLKFGWHNISLLIIVNTMYLPTPKVPNPPGPIEIITKSTTSIEARWTDAPQMNGTSFFYQLTIAPPEGSGHINTTNISHTFEPLLSGTPHNISMATIGVLGFRSDVIHAYLVTTSKLFFFFNICIHKVA